MKTQSIDQLKELLDTMDGDLDAFDTSKFKGVTYGEEGEFTAKSLILGARAATVDIRGLIAKPEKILRLTTATERRSLVSSLSVLKTGLQAEQLPSIATVLQEIKIILRPLQLRGSPETRDQLEQAVNDLHKRIAEIGDERNRIREEQAKLVELLQLISDRNEDSGTKLAEIEVARTSLDELVASSSARFAEIEEFKASSESACAATEASQVAALQSKDAVEEFFRRISARESQLVDQQAKTDAYSDELAKHQATMAGIQSEAAAIIDSARTALSYKTAEGLSAAFIERYNETRLDKQRKFWLWGAGALVLGAVGLGVWITWDTQVTLAVVAGRVSLIPILIAGAWFCAHQYVKLANISEEYAYKSVLSKSIVGFSEQMSRENEVESDYSHYIRTVLAEIHTNPLRTSSKPAAAANGGSEVDGAERLLKLLSDFQRLSK